MKRVVYHVNQMNDWPMLMKCLAHGDEMFTSLKVVVVANGRAVRIVERPELIDAFRPWLNKGVRLELSKPSVIEEGINIERAKEAGAEVIASGVAALINYQHDHYAYIRI